MYDRSANCLDHSAYPSLVVFVDQVPANPQDFKWIEESQGFLFIRDMDPESPFLPATPTYIEEIRTWSVASF